MRLLIQPSARTDILRQYAYYLDQDVPAVAERFLDAVRQSIEAVAALPGAGAPKQTANPQLAGLRSWPVKDFDDIRIYYVVREGVLQIVRILHGKRDIGVILASQDVDTPDSRE